MRGRGRWWWAAWKRRAKFGRSTIFYSFTFRTLVSNFQDIFTASPNNYYTTTKITNDGTKKKVQLSTLKNPARYQIIWSFCFFEFSHFFPQSTTSTFFAWKIHSLQKPATKLLWCDHNGYVDDLADDDTIMSRKNLPTTISLFNHVSPTSTRLRTIVAMWMNAQKLEKLRKSHFFLVFSFQWFFLLSSIFSHFVIVSMF